MFKELLYSAKECRFVEIREGNSWVNNNFDFAIWDLYENNILKGWKWNSKGFSPDTIYETRYQALQGVKEHFKHMGQDVNNIDFKLRRSTDTKYSVFINDVNTHLTVVGSSTAWSLNDDTYWYIENICELNFPLYESVFNTRRQVVEFVVNNISAHLEKFVEKDKSYNYGSSWKNFWKHFIKPEVDLQKIFKPL